MIELTLGSGISTKVFTSVRSGILLTQLNNRLIILGQTDITGVGEYEIKVINLPNVCPNYGIFSLVFTQPRVFLPLLIRPKAYGHRGLPRSFLERQESVLLQWV